MKNLQALFEHELKDLYSAEKQLIEVLPKIIDSASDSKLQKALSNHLKQTKSHKEKVDKILNELDVKRGDTKCDAMAGLIKECEGMLDSKATPEVMDAGIIARVQRCEHYEITGYGTAKLYAMTLGHDDIAKKLDDILDEESRCNEDLNDLAVQEINKKAK